MCVNVTNASGRSEQQPQVVNMPLAQVQTALAYVFKHCHSSSVGIVLVPLQSKQGSEKKMTQQQPVVDLDVDSERSWPQPRQSPLPGSNSDEQIQIESLGTLSQIVIKSY